MDVDVNFDVEAIPAGLLDDWEMEADIGTGTSEGMDISTLTVDQLIDANASLNWMSFIAEPPAATSIDTSLQSAIDAASIAFPDLAALETEDLVDMIDGDLPSSGDDASPQRSPAEPITPEYYNDPNAIMQQAIAPNLIHGVPFASTEQYAAASATQFQPHSPESGSDLPATSAPKKSRKRPRKRQKLSQDEDLAIIGKTAVSLPREQLLAFSSTELEAYIENIAKQRPLTKEEQKEFKRQRRLIKNRESASLSRQRKKVFISDLQSQAHNIVSENARLKAQVESLGRENKALKDEVATLQNIVRRSSLLSRIFNAVTTIKKTGQVSLGGLSNQATAHAGIALMIVLFSFGLLFNHAGTRVGDAGPALPFEKFSFPRGFGAEPIAAAPPSAVVPYAGRVFGSQEQVRSYGAGGGGGGANGNGVYQNGNEVYRGSRSLLEKEGAVEMDEAQPEVPLRRTNGSASAAHAEPIKGRAFSETSLLEEASSESETLEASTPKVDNAPYRVVRLDSTPTDGAPIKPIDWRPNTTYLLCNDVQELIPVDPSMAPVDPNSPFVVALLLPPQALGSQYQAVGSGQGAETDGMIEVTCQVLDVTYTPFDSAKFAMAPNLVSA